MWSTVQLSFNKRFVSVFLVNQSDKQHFVAGEIWTWGKGDYYRLGHNSDQHVRKPTPIQGLRGLRVIHVAVGALHCLAVTDTGQVYAWGDNDHGQQVRVG